MNQPALPGFSVPPEPILVPVQGRTPAAREASASGARQAVKTHGAKMSALLQVLGNGGPLTRNELAGILGFPLASVCSLLASAIEQELAEGTGQHQVMLWPDGGLTKRETFRIRRTRGTRSDK